MPTNTRINLWNVVFSAVLYLYDYGKKLTPLYYYVSQSEELIKLG